MKNSKVLKLFTLICLLCFAGTVIAQYNPPGGGVTSSENEQDQQKLKAMHAGYLNFNTMEPLTRDALTAKNKLQDALNGETPGYAATYKLGKLCENMGLYYRGPLSEQGDFELPPWVVDLSNGQQCGEIPQSYQDAKYTFDADNPNWIADKMNEYGVVIDHSVYLGTTLVDAPNSIAGP